MGTYKDQLIADADEAAELDRNSQINLVVKIETDSISATRVIVLTLYDVTSDTLLSFSDRPGANPINAAVKLLPLADALIVQTTYAIKTLESLYGLVIDPEQVIDLYALAKRLRPHEPHGIDSWARRLGVYRRKFLGAPRWTAEAQAHCERDARIVGMIYASLYDLVDL
jgi:hypothetical protein